jgi:hypothetical protein
MGIEPCRSLEEALAAEPARLANGTGVPAGVCPKVIALRNRATYSPQVKRFLDLFGSSQVKLFRFEEFQANPAMLFRETCRFLGVRDDVCPPPKPHNVGRQVKSARWHEFLTRSPKWAQTFTRVALPFPILRKNLQKLLVRRNQRAGKPAPLSRDLRFRLNQEFSPDIAELSRLTGWDLCHWQQ